jgi:hypothetical protein
MAPEPGQSRELHIGGGIQDVRVEEDPVQGEARRTRPALSALCSPMMLDAVGIEAHAFHLGSYPTIVLATDSIIQDKFGPTFRRIDFYWEHRRRPDQDSVFALFGHNERPLFDAQVTAELRWQHDCATPPPLLANASMITEYRRIRISSKAISEIEPSRPKPSLCCFVELGSYAGG